MGKRQTTKDNKNLIKKTFRTLRERRDGYMTIELTMIFSVMFFALLLILFMGLVLYQEVHLQSIAVAASERGSIIYSSRVTDMTAPEKTLEDYKKRDPYRNIPFMDSGTQQNYRSIVNAYAADQLGNKNVINGTLTNAGNYTTIEDYIIFKKVRVNIKSSYDMPVASIPRMFGREGPFTVDTTAIAAVVDSPEFIRTADLAVDVAKQSSIFTKAEEGYNKIRDMLDKAKALLE